MSSDIEKPRFENQPKIVIENGNMENLEQIVRFNYEIFDGMYENEPYSLEQYQDKLKGTEPIIFIAKEDDELAGDSISFGRDNSFYIWILGVNKKHRGKGIGSSLLDKNEQFAQENGYESISAKVYNVSVEMQRLLKQRGYEVVKVEESETDPRNTALWFELKFKG
jgi:ribosomal protein S18 acetylase RimI-like enzyme